MKEKIICIHIGARAHYLIPKSFELDDKLLVLVTDTWIRSKLVRLVLSKIPVRLFKSFASRYSPSIPSGKVRSFGLRFLFAEFFLRRKYKDGWELILQRNEKFEEIAFDIFKKLPAENPVFGISYTAHKVFALASQRKQKTILFQIDPGLVEENIVADITARYGDKFSTHWERAPSSYWDNWLKECELSDVIMVNSEWSKAGLTEVNINPDKIKILPLPFQLENRHLAFKRTYPAAFNSERPLRCLFLGTLTLRKGIHLVLEAAAALIGKPVEFILVGHSELDAELYNQDNISYKGLATRAETDEYYRQADLFLFPTLSDGFGLTQLEAMAWSLPVMASKYCGDVVTEGHNGFLLSACTSPMIIDILNECLEHPEQLSLLSSNCIDTAEQFGLDAFAKGMLELV